MTCDSVGVIDDEPISRTESTWQMPIEEFTNDNLAFNASFPQMRYRASGFLKFEPHSFRRIHKDGLSSWVHCRLKQYKRTRLKSDRLPYLLPLVFRCQCFPMTIVARDGHSEFATRSTKAIASPQSIADAFGYAL
jgi:hypothetical protein